MRADRITCSAVTSTRGEQNEQDEQNMTSFYPSRFEEGCIRQSEQNSESVASGQRRISPVELGGHGIRQSVEDLRAQFGEGLRVQQEMFSNTRAELQALQTELGAQREMIVNAWAVLGSSMTGMRGPGNESTRAQTSSEVGQRTPVVNALVDAASEQSIQSLNGFGGVQTPSIYLTPAGGANPVYLSGNKRSNCRTGDEQHRSRVNTVADVRLNGANYYSPELFSPADTVYYTAQNTCVPASARFQPEQTEF